MAPGNPDRLTLTGNDNYGRPRQLFADKLAAMDDEKFLSEAGHYIWLSAYATNNPRSDFHWQCDATYDEANRRGKAWLYDKAWCLTSGLAEWDDETNTRREPH
jgi:hypothetical protein